MIEVAYVSHMGSDDSVCDAARVSFRKQAANFTPAANAKLIAYLARNGHWSPFAHPQISVRVTAPIFVARQCFKSKVGFAENEVSRRYVDAAPEFYRPARWRGKPTHSKQGSSAIEVFSVALADGEIVSPSLLVEDVYRYAREAYDALIAGGVAPEQARMVLPQAMLTEWIWTGSLAAFARFCALRLSQDAQAETAEVAFQCARIIEPLFPASWVALAAWRGEAARESAA
jgi:thymidylate synthase (FAD)